MVVITVKSPRFDRCTGHFCCFHIVLISTNFCPAVHYLGKTKNIEQKLGKIWEIRDNFSKFLVNKGGAKKFCTFLVNWS